MYLMCGQMLAKTRARRPTRASGSRRASPRRKAKGDTHALGELESALDALLVGSPFLRDARSLDALLHARSSPRSVGS